MTHKPIRDALREAPFMGPFLMYSGGFAALVALLTAIAAATGTRFEFASHGSSGVPVPHTWTHAAMLLGVGSLLYALGRRWSAPAFVAWRSRFPWAVPLLFVTVVLPGGVAVLFLLVR